MVRRTGISNETVLSAPAQGDSDKDRRDPNQQTSVMSAPAISSDTPGSGRAANRARLPSSFDSDS